MNYEQLKYVEYHIILTGKVPHKEPPSQTSGSICRLVMYCDYNYTVK
jgi:hypothetical protein